MRIADIEVINLLFDYPERSGFRYAGGVVTSRVTSIIRVTTESGTVGLGAAYSQPDLVRWIIEKQFKPLLLGEDPREVERLWDMMYGVTRWYGRKGVALSALGGIDIALWDLRGKDAGLPLYRMFGGDRAAVPAYASGLFWQDDMRLLEQEAAAHRAQGFKRMKMRLGRGEEYDRAALAAAKRGAGADGDVLVDGSHRYPLDAAISFGKILAEQNVFWFEEPFPPEEIDSYLALRPALDVPLAAGENEFGAQGFRELLRAGAVGIAQPDACRTGGLTECLRIARMAAESGVGIATHTWSDAVALIANAHFVAALPHGITVEVDRSGNPFIDELLTEPLRISDGMLLLSDAPGLGIELNTATLARLAVPPDQTIPDGNYSDLVFGKQYLTIPAPYLTR